MCAYLDSGDMRTFLGATRVVNGPSSHCLTTICSKDGFMLLKDKVAVANRWKEHHKDLLNRNTSPEMEILKQLPQQPIAESMGEPPSLSEVQDAVGIMRNNKVSGPGGIPAGVLKKGGPDLLTKILASFLIIWENEKIPADLKNAVNISFFKKID